MLLRLLKGVAIKDVTQPVGKSQGLNETAIVKWTGKKLKLPLSYFDCAHQVYLINFNKWQT